MIPARLAGQSKKAAKDQACFMLDKLGLSQRLNHRPARLSGGEQQRVAIARSLANQPKILLADEPTGNLDPKTAEIVFDLLMELVRERSIAALIATHNFELAARMDRGLVLDQGKLKQQHGTRPSTIPSTVRRAHLGHRTVCSFARSVRLLAAQWCNRIC